MRLLKSCLLSFSYYLRIPVPQMEYQEHDGDYLFCFFPLAGAVIGLAEFLWILIAQHLKIGIPMSAAAAVAIPVLLTGGIHLDGFLDTADALASWRSREERLKIMHDPHTGAFAVIYCGMYLLLAYGIVSELCVRLPLAGCLVFCLGRVFSALLVVFEQPAVKGGMLFTCTQHALKRAVTVSTAVYLVLMTLFAWWRGFLLPWGIMTTAALIIWIVYRWFIRRTFGGVTGDLAGCFLSVCELLLGAVLVFCI